MCRSIVLGFALAALVLSCTVQRTARVTGVGGDPPGSEPDPSQTLTYYQQVAPILGEKCVPCHQPGQIGPFSLTSYEETVAHAAEIAESVRLNKMPPMPPKQLGCQALDDPRNMSDEARQTLVYWAAGLHKEGDPNAPAPVPPPETTIGPPSTTIDSGFDYLAPAGVSDDYRCFIVDPKLTSSYDLVAVATTSTNPAVVHHTIVYQQPPEQTAAADALDEADPGPGYSCFGGVGFPNATILSASAVGSSPRPFPAGSGVTLTPGTRFVVEMHYNYDNQHAANHFNLDLWRATAPLTQAPQQVIISNEGFDIPAGAVGVQAGADKPVNGPGKLWTMFPHMHQLGRSFYIELDHPDGSNECLLNIDGTWDFHWQGLYQVAQPVQVNTGDRVKINCTWDNTAANQPIVGGVPLQPHDVRYGERSVDEMCVGYITFTE